MRQVIEFAGALQVALRGLQFYSADHPQSRQALATLDRTARALLGAQLRVTVTLSGGKLLVDGNVVDAKGPQITKLGETFMLHGVGGVTLTSGFTEREIADLVKVLAMKPEAVKEAGGAQKVLDELGAIHVRLSLVRYEAITEGEEVVWSNAVRPVDPNAKESLPDLLRAFLSRHVGPLHPDTGATNGQGEGGGGGIEPAAPPEAALLDMFKEQADAGGDEGRDLLRNAIEGLQPELQLALLLSISKMPEGALREVLKPLAATMAAKVVEEGLSGEGGPGLGATEGGGVTGDASDFLSRLLRVLPEPDRDVQLLKGRMQELGVTREQLDIVLAVVAWDTLSIDQRMEKLTDSQIMFDLAAEKFIAFIRSLLENKRYADALALLEKYAAGFSNNALHIRRKTCDVFGQVARYMPSPGTNADIDRLLLKAAFNYLLTEEDYKLQALAADSAAIVAGGFVATGRVAVAHSNLMRAGALLASSPNGAKREAYMALVRAISMPDRMKELTDQMFSTDNEKFTNEVLPYITFLGAPITHALVEALGEEEDRSRRGRLVRALKAIGTPAYPALVEALHGRVWFVVRNALNVLGDIGAPELVAEIGGALQHSDQRVRRAAVRALGKIRGEQAEQLLIEALVEKDRETLHEILICLGAMKAELAVGPLIEMARPRRLGGDDAVREMVIATLGQIGSTDAVPVLVEVASKRTAFGSPALRIAAAKSLASIDNDDARDALQKIVAAETQAAVKSQMQALVRE